MNCRNGKNAPSILCVRRPLSRKNRKRIKGKPWLWRPNRRRKSRRKGKRRKSPAVLIPSLAPGESVLPEDKSQNRNRESGSRDRNGGRSRNREYLPAATVENPVITAHIAARTSPTGERKKANKFVFPSFCGKYQPAAKKQAAGFSLSSRMLPSYVILSAPFHCHPERSDCARRRVQAANRPKGGS